MTFFRAPASLKKSTCSQRRWSQQRYFLVPRVVWCTIVVATSPGFCLNSPAGMKHLIFPAALASGSDPLKPPETSPSRKFQWTGQLSSFSSVAHWTAASSVSNVKKNGLVVTVDVVFTHSLDRISCQRGAEVSQVDDRSQFSTSEGGYASTVG